MRRLRWRGRAETGQSHACSTTLNWRCCDGRPARADQERPDGHQSRGPGEARRPGDGESQQQDVPGHVRREDVAEAEVARRIDQPAGASQQDQATRSGRSETSVDKKPSHGPVRQRRPASDRAPTPGELAPQRGCCCPRGSRSAAASRPARPGPQAAGVLPRDAILPGPASHPLALPRTQRAAPDCWVRQRAAGAGSACPVFLPDPR